MSTILFLNHRVKECGVYQYGFRVAQILRSGISDTKYVEIETYDDYMQAMHGTSDLKAVVFNYNTTTMPWLKHEHLHRSMKNFGILHDCGNDIGFDFIISIDPDSPSSTNQFPIPRPLYAISDFDYTPNDRDVYSFVQAYQDKDVPIFGSFGFGFHNRGFSKVVQMVNDQYDDAIIKFIIPKAYYGPSPDDVVNHINRISVKPGVKVMIFTSFVSNDDLLYFLSSNTLNIFLYDSLLDRGISSVIDYALSVPVPIGISDSNMFRHIYSDDICLYKRKIKEVIANGSRCLNRFCDAWHPDRLIQAFRQYV